MKSKHRVLSRSLALLMSLVLLFGNAGFVSLAAEAGDPASALESVLVTQEEELPLGEEEAAGTTAPAAEEAQGTPAPGAEELIDPADPAGELSEGSLSEVTPGETPAGTEEIAPETPSAGEEIDPAEPEEGEEILTEEGLEEAVEEPAELVTDEAALDGEIVKYGVWVNGIQITEENKDNVLNDASASVVFDPREFALYLDEASLRSLPVTGENITAAIYSKDYDRTLILRPKQGAESRVTTIDMTGEQSNIRYNGIFGRSHLRIENLQLQIVGSIENTGNNYNWIYGICLQGNNPSVTVGKSKIDIDLQHTGNKTGLVGITADSVNANQSELNIKITESEYPGGIMAVTNLKDSKLSVKVEAATDKQIIGVHSLYATDSTADIYVKSTVPNENCSGVYYLGLLGKYDGSHVIVKAEDTGDFATGIRGDVILDDYSTVEFSGTGQAIFGETLVYESTPDGVYEVPLQGRDTSVNVDPTAEGADPFNWSSADKIDWSQYRYGYIFKRQGTPYTVTFAPDNGDDPFTRTVWSGLYIRQPEDPQKKDHQFLGWYKDGAEEPFDFEHDQEIDSNFTLTARWEDLAGTHYDIWVGGPEGAVEITDANKDDVLADGGSVTFDPDTATLFLNDAQLTPAHVEGLGAYAALYIGEEAPVAPGETHLIISTDPQAVGNKSEIGMALPDVAVTDSAVYGLYSKKDLSVDHTGESWLRFDVRLAQTANTGEIDLVGIFAPNLILNATDLVLDIAGKNVTGLKVEQILTAYDDDFQITTKTNGGTAVGADIGHDLSAYNCKVLIQTTGTGEGSAVYGICGDVDASFYDSDVTIESNGVNEYTYGIFTTSEVMFQEDDENGYGGTYATVKATVRGNANGYAISALGHYSSVYISKESKLEAIGGASAILTTEFSYHEEGRPILVNEEAEAQGAQPWDGTSALNTYRYFLTAGKDVRLLPGEGGGDPVVTWQMGDTYNLPKAVAAFTAPTGKKLTGWQDKNGNSLERGAEVTLEERFNIYTALWGERDSEVTFRMEVYDEDGTTLLPEEEGGLLQWKDEEDNIHSVTYGEALQIPDGRIEVSLEELYTGYDFVEFYVENVNGTDETVGIDSFPLDLEDDAVITVRFRVNSAETYVVLNRGTDEEAFAQAVREALTASSLVSKVEEADAENAFKVFVPEAISTGALLTALEEALGSVKTTEGLHAPHVIAFNDMSYFTDDEEIAEQFAGKERIEEAQDIYFLWDTRIDAIEVGIDEALCGDEVWLDQEGNYSGPEATLYTEDIELVTIRCKDAEGNVLTDDTLLGGETYELELTLKAAFGSFIPSDVEVTVRNMPDAPVRVVDGGINIAFVPEHVLEEVDEPHGWHCTECDKYFLDPDGSTEAVLISFDPGEGEGEMASLLHPVSDAYVLPDNGFTAPDEKMFDGWLVDDAVRSVGEEVHFTENKVLTAQWKIDPTVYYTVTFDPDNGEEEVHVRVAEGTPAERPAEDPEKEGFVFDDWFEGEEAYDFAKPVTESLTLTAHWVEIEDDTELEPRDIAYIREKTKSDEHPNGFVPKGVWAVLWDEADEDIIYQEGRDVGVETEIIYNGVAHKPKVHVYHGLVRLTEKKDYTISYKNNTNASVNAFGNPIVEPKKLPTVTINAKGNYREKKPVTFRIYPETMEEDNDKIIADELFAFRQTKPTQKVKVTIPVSFINAKEKIKKLSAGKDYTLRVTTITDLEGNKITGDTARAAYFTPGNKDAFFTALQQGVYTVEITGINNFFETREVTVRVEPAKVPMSKVNVKIVNKASELIWTGDPVLPSIQVKGKNGQNYEEVLARDGESFDYKEGNTFVVKRIENNVNVGVARVTVGPKDETVPFEGEKTVSFKILKAGDLKKAVITWPQAVGYTGAPIVFEESEVKVLDASGKLLTEGTDFTVSYKNNVKAGRATMTFTGAKDSAFAGTSVNKTFKIEKINLETAGDKLTFTLNEEEMTGSNAPNVPFLTGGAKPKPVVTYEDAERGVALTLVEGTDYSISYKDNKKLGAATLTISGKGSFEKKASRTFIIVPQTNEETDEYDRTPVHIEAKDVLLKANTGLKAGAWMSKPKVVDANGKTLKAGKDYDAVSFFLDENCEDRPIYKTDALSTKLEDGEILQGKMIYMKAKGLGNYQGAEIFGAYHIMTGDVTKAVVTIIDPEYSKKGFEYTGKPIEPKPHQITVFVKGVGNLSAVTPESGEDGYEIVPGSYTKNLNRGTGSFVIRGLGNIGGSKKVTFKIYQRGVSTWWLARLARMFGLG